MTATTWFLLSLSIIVPAIAGLIRCKSISGKDYPFLICIWIGLFVEIFSYLLLKKGYSNVLVSNVYVLIESLLLILQFRNWDSRKNKDRRFIILIVVLVVVWIFTGFILKPWYYTNSYFRVIYSVIIVLMAIDFINKLVVAEKKSMVRNYRFLLCAGFILYYVFNILVETFYIYDTGANADLPNRLFDIKAWCNFIVNFLYALAILWIPRKKIFIFP